MINKQILISLVSFIFSVSAFGQISQGGLPPSFKQKNLLKSTPSIANIPVNLDVKKLIWEDEIVEGNGGPVKVAEVLPVDINIETTGNWTTYSDSVKIWRQTIVAEDAIGLILSYKDFYIPEGAQLFIYNDDHSQVLGAYTRSTHPEGGKFATEIVLGDKVTLEYVASSISKESPRIIVKEIGYVYNANSLRQVYMTNAISWPCMVNVNCPAGDNWKNQKRGVVKYIVNISGWYACSGSLVNNTRRDGAPYLLTANHCFVQDVGHPEYETIIVYFNYEYPGCTDGVMPTPKTIVGTTLLVSAPLSETTGGVTIQGADGALLKLDNSIPKEWDPFYNGWDRRDSPATSGVVIHHPNGDVKKITTFDKPATTGTFSAKLTGVQDGFWKVVYDGNGVTQGGSSGGPLFSQEGLIVGNLTGGSSECDSKFSPDYYGKFGYNWDYYKEARRQLKTYLDPINEGTMTLKGFDPNYPTGIEPEIVDNSPKDIVVFPTLADNEVSINANSIIRSIRIFDLAGHQVYAKSGYNASTTTISVNDWQKGVYSIVVQTDTGNKNEKFIKK